MFLFKNRYQFSDDLFFRFCYVCMALLAIIVLLCFRLNQINSSITGHLQSDTGGFVRVAGAVRHPGVYMIPVNKMAASAIVMAIPIRALSQAELEQLDSMPLANGDALQVIFSGNTTQVVKGKISAAQRMVLNIPLDITDMNESDFSLLPGIGAVTAHRIMEFRHKNGGFMSVNDLKLVEGIGEKRFNDIKKYFN